MKIIVPMAGMGKRMRPHTLTVPKPLIPIAGKPIVQRLVEDIAHSTSENIEEIAFIIGHFGKEVEDQLLGIAEKMGAKGSLFYQEEPLGTAHAILCAKEALQGHLIIAFADTLFKAQFQIDTEKDGIIWVKQIDDPSSFGVVKLDENGYITDFVEKPDTFVSDLAIIGVYYIRDGEKLREEIEYLIENDIKDKGEFQLTNALENLKSKGHKFATGSVDEWLDCGNKDSTVYTNQRILELKKDEELIAGDLKLENAAVIEPCYIAENVTIKNAVVGPHVSLGAHTHIENSVVSNSIFQENVVLKNKVIHNSMVGNFAVCEGIKEELSISDYSTQK